MVGGGGKVGGGGNGVHVGVGMGVTVGSGVLEGFGVGVTAVTKVLALAAARKPSPALVAVTNIVPLMLAPTVNGPRVWLVPSCASSALLTKVVVPDASVSWAEPVLFTAASDQAMAVKGNGLLFVSAMQ